MDWQLIKKSSKPKNALIASNRTSNVHTMSPTASLNTIIYLCCTVDSTVKEGFQFFAVFVPLFEIKLNQLNTEKNINVYYIKLVVGILRQI